MRMSKTSCRQNRQVDGKINLSENVKQSGRDGVDELFLCQMSNTWPVDKLKVG